MHASCRKNRLQLFGHPQLTSTRRILVSRCGYAFEVHGLHQLVFAKPALLQTYQAKRSMKELKVKHL